MKFKGFRQISLVDYPRKISSVIFVGGCNLDCFYCHNVELPNQKDISSDFVLDKIIERKNIVEGIVISGGEPTYYPKIFSLCSWIKKVIKLPIKLDTNGMRPEVLEDLIRNNLVDYVALDIKTIPFDYIKLGGDGRKLLKSIDVVQDVDHEIRTTCVPSLVNMDKLHEIAKYVHKSSWYLQQYQQVDYCQEIPYTRQELEHFKDCLGKYFNVSLRNL